MSIERQLNIDFSGQDNKSNNKFEAEAQETEGLENEVTDLMINKLIKSVQRPIPRKLIKKDKEPVLSLTPENINQVSITECPDPYGDIYPLSRDLRRQRK